ncbi:MAG TPA: DapH/DapD/GlmU-related protein, partial [Acinetobacter johnsonii]|nr:DapH/DapD/GlmU-related protein [Acinetobacter johnsonii]
AAFIGSNSSLVAPVTIGNGATVGAGSTITRDVAENSLAVERSKQVEKENYQRPQKMKK